MGIVRRPPAVVMGGCYRSRAVRRPRRQSLALTVSLVSHLGLLGGASFSVRCTPHIDMPELDFELAEVELLDPDQLQGAEQHPEPEPPPPAPVAAEPPPPPPTPADEKSPEEKPPPEEEKPKPKKKFAARGSRADRLAPPQSTWSILLIPKRIRKLPFRETVLDVMAPLPDFELLIDRGRFDALRDFDHILIASPDIRDWTQTFVAVDYRVSREEVQRGIERAAASRDEVVEWVDDGGPLRANPRPADPKKEDADERWFVFLEGKVAIYVRPEFLDNILQGPADDDRKTAGNYVANLAKIRRIAARQPKAGLQVVISDLSDKVTKNPLPFAVPDHIEFSASAAKEPEVALRFEFINVVEAKAFGLWWSGTLPKIIDKIPGGAWVAQPIYDALTLTRDDAKVQIKGQLGEGQAEMLLRMIADSSSKNLGKTPKELADMQQRRIEAWKARRKGKLPPSVLDPAEDPEPSSPAAPKARLVLPGARTSGAPADSPPERGGRVPKPAKTPAKDGAEP